MLCLIHSSKITSHSVVVYDGDREHLNVNVHDINTHCATPGKHSGICLIDTGYLSEFIGNHGEKARPHSTDQGIADTFWRDLLVVKLMCIPFKSCTPIIQKVTKINAVFKEMTK